MNMNINESGNKKYWIFSLNEHRKEILNSNRYPISNRKGSNGQFCCFDIRRFFAQFCFQTAFGVPPSVSARINPAACGRTAQLKPTNSR